MPSISIPPRRDERPRDLRFDGQPDARQGVTAPRSTHPAASGLTASRGTPRSAAAAPDLSSHGGWLRELPACLALVAFIAAFLFLPDVLSLLAEIR